MLFPASYGRLSKPFQSCSLSSQAHKYAISDHGQCKISIVTIEDTTTGQSFDNILILIHELMRTPGYPKSSEKPRIIKKGKDPRASRSRDLSSFVPHPTTRVMPPRFSQRSSHPLFRTSSPQSCSSAVPPAPSLGGTGSGRSPADDVKRQRLSYCSGLDSSRGMLCCPCRCDGIKVMLNPISGFSVLSKLVLLHPKTWLFQSLRDLDAGDAGRW